jgi:hypothetical protein
MNRLAQWWTLWIVSAAAAVEGGTTIQPQENWSGVFADSDVTFRYAVAADQPQPIQLGWRLSIDRRTVLRGERSLDLGPGEPTIVEVPFKVPHVKEGVTIEATLQVSVIGKGATPSPAEHVRPITIFPRNPFANRSEWLKAVKITLFDPEGETAAAFESTEIPFRHLRRTAALEEPFDGLLVIGEGVSFEQYRSLSETAGKLAASGIPVLCLAPADGAWAMPGAGDSGPPLPTRVSLRRGDVIGELDKRLDSAAWPPDGRTVASRMAIRSRRQGVILEVMADGAPGSEAAWPWVEVRYPKKNSSLLFCGFAIIRQWDAGPTPRFLLARIIERLAKRK